MSDLYEGPFAEPDTREEYEGWKQEQDDASE